MAGMVLASCAGLKKKDRPRYDLMDNLTSRYNIIHHSREMIADAEQHNRQAHRENYRHLLPVFVEPTEVSASSHALLMDSVIGKARRIINEKADGKYVNEAWFLTGQAYYLKANYYNAAEFFGYAAGISDGLPKLRQRALIWQARALMQLQSISLAGEVLDSVRSGLDQHKQSRGYAQATLAQYHLLRGEEKEAITALSMAIGHRGKTSDKLRWHYLLAQLLERHNYRQDAIRHYRRVARSNVDYEMAFNASLNQLFLETRGHPDEQRQLRAFRSMLRDDKNKEFRDRILYYLGETHYRYGHYDEAIDFFNKSLGTGSTNLYQKAMTYMRLADHFFENRGFTDALAYYDSAAMVLPIDYPDGEPVRRKLSHMGELIAHLRTIERQDSLQYLAAMDEGQRRQVLDTVIQVRYQTLLAKRSEQQQQSERQQRHGQQEVRISPFDQVRSGENVPAYFDNRFYFNNPDAIGMGMGAFRRTWGNRELQDNWRWSNARGTSGADETLASDPGSAAAEDVENAGLAEDIDLGLPDSLAFAEMIRQSYESDLPLDPEQLGASHQQIKIALERIGEMYRYGLQDNEGATDSYRELLARYPSDPGRAAWLYQLVLLAGPDSPGAVPYRETLLAEFPESRYTKTLTEPNYLHSLANEKKRLAEQYHAIYELYLNGSYEEIIREVDRLIDAAAEQDRAKQDELRGMHAQLAYLRALAIGRIAEPARFKAEMEALTIAFPKDSLVTPLAKQHLAFMEAHAEEFAERQFALAEKAQQDSIRFVEEPGLMRWPQLVIRSGPEAPRDTRVFENAGTGRPKALDSASLPATPGTLEQRQISTGSAGTGTARPDPIKRTTRNLEILPDSATYYFVINVMHPRVNLAPSRFGIGQFNRTRYAGEAISHQLKQIEDEAQLIYVGPFKSYAQAKQYENRILPMITDIMKVPEDVYNTFLITESVFGTLSDFEKVDNYVHFYQGL